MASKANNARGARSVSRASTPDDSEWAGRLRGSSRTPQLEHAAIPARNTRSKATHSRAGFVAGSISVTSSVAARSAGAQLDTPARTSRALGTAPGNRGARSGISNNSYGTGLATLSSQMGTGSAAMGLAGVMGDELEQQIVTARNRFARTKPIRSRSQSPLEDSDGEEINPFNHASTLHSIDQSKSYGDGHENGMGAFGRPGTGKSFSRAHEDGMSGGRGGVIERSPSPYSPKEPTATPEPVRSAYQGSPSPEFPEIQSRVQPHRQPFAQLEMLRSYRIYIWGVTHKRLLQSLLLIPLLAFLLYTFGPALIDKLPSAPAYIPGSNNTLPTVTITAHPRPATTTVTKSIRTTVVNGALVSEVRALESKVHRLELLTNTPRQNRVNFFSPVLGAYVDAGLTSPTITNGRGWKKFVHKAMFFTPGNLPAITALQSWHEAGECWCAAPTINGTIQLGIVSAKRIKADAITIEHVNKDAALDIKSAPKVVEVWAEVGMDFTGEAPGAGCQSPGPGLGFACLGKVEYDYSKVENVQMGRLEVTNVPSQRFVVRVMENWGESWTCLYRVQIHGERVTEPFQ